MLTLKNKFYITTPIYYVNADPHIGSAYTTIAADVLARYHRMINDEVFFLTGTDEHGAKIEEKAKEAGMEPQKFVDEIAAKFEFAWDELNISNDNFIRTTDLRHKKAVQNSLQHLYDKGDIYLGKYEGLYCRGCEQYKSEKDLVNGKCPDHNKKPEKTSEEGYMFKMSKYSEKILKKIKSDEFKIMPASRKNEILNFYKGGLKDIAFSRKNVKWGIPLPWDKGHTAYVWADAFLNYLTGVNWSGAVGARHGACLQFKEYWPTDLHLMSKDILRVHSTIWPAMLLALDLPLPKQLFIHGFFLVDGKKMSKSLGNIIAPSDMVKKYGVDGARYLLMSATPFGHDGDVSFEKFDEKYNADLANGVGNLVSRTTTMVENYFDGKLHEINKEHTEGLKLDIILDQYDPDNIIALNTDRIGQIIHRSIEDIFKEELDLIYKESFFELKIDQSLESVFRLVRKCDKYINQYKPFKLIKEDKEKTAGVLYNCLEGIRIIAWMLLPFMPDTAKKIWLQLGLNPAKEMKKDFNKAIEWGGLSPDTKIKKGDVLFPRI